MFFQLLNDANRKYPDCGDISHLEVVANKIFERVQRQFKGDSMPKKYLQSFQNSADPVVLSLVLLPFLFTAVNKRASNGVAKISKQDMYNGFFPHFPVKI